MTSPKAADLDRFAVARNAYEAGRSLEAYGLAAAILQTSPRFADAHHLMALCLIDLRDFGAAEQALRAALAIDKRNPGLHALLGDLLRRPTRLAEAERCYRAALALDRRFPPALIGLAKLLIPLGRAKEALALTAPVAARADASVGLLELHADALKHLGRAEAALEANRRAIEAGSRSARLEDASLLRELGRFEEAEAAAQAAFAVVGASAGAFVIHARTLQDLGRFDQAEAACRQALQRDPLDDRAHEHLAQLMLRRSGDAKSAQQLLDAVFQQQPTPALTILKAKLLTRSGARHEAYALLAHAARQAPDDVSLQSAAAKAALDRTKADPEDADLALAHAERAYALAHDVPKVAALVAETCLAAGQPERAASLAEKLLRRSDSSELIALQAVAWRLMGDPRYQELYDYERVVGSWIIEPPEGWPNLQAYLADLAAALRVFHDVPLDAFGMTRPDKDQTKHALAASSGDRIIRGFYEALDAPIRDYLSRIGKGRDALRRRNQGDYRPLSAWSVKTETNGFHVDHLHSEGWLSSAFYVELPPAVEAEGRQGWIKFGEPGVRTRPALEAQHYVKPDPGRFVLFPSYMWHGTVPFTGPGERLIMSVDLVPRGD
jgi:tetratricopeptide (TPR) repeat protein